MTLKQWPPRKWNEIIDELQENIFTYFTEWLIPLEITENNAQVYFSIDYESATSIYTDEYIHTIAQMVAQTNSKKYDKLIAAYQSIYDPLNNYDFTEMETETRTPNISHSTTASSSGTANGNSTTTSKTNQTQNTTETPNNLASTAIHEINPYDNTGFAQQDKTTTTQSGNKSISVAYTGEPDSTGTTSSSTNSTSATNTTTETGTETRERELTRQGYYNRDPVASIDEEMRISERMNIFRIICRDIAAKIFLQVWL